MSSNKKEIVLLRNKYETPEINLCVKHWVCASLQESTSDKEQG